VAGKQQRRLSISDEQATMLRSWRRQCEYTV
jgi:hypothetical protein